jgi:glucose-6-phosphate dehydrogenase assembly protein OpcA
MAVTEDIQIANIEKELDNLCDAQTGSSRTKACLFNFVIYSPEKRRIEYLQNIVQATIEKFPCRIFFIQCDPDPSQNYLHVDVSTETLKLDPSVACDQILIKTTSQQINRVPFIILPYLVPDLPIHLLWGQDPTTEKVVLPYLQEYAARMIFDSDCTDNLKNFSNNILALMKTWPHQEFTDVNWVLTSYWRKALSQVFDSPTAIQRLNLNKGIIIRYNEPQSDWLRHTERQSMYLAWWLATQLKWEFRSQKEHMGKHELTFFNGINEFVITLWPEVHQGINPGIVTGFELSSSDDHFYFISPMENLPKVSVHISTLETCDLPFSFPMPVLKKGFPAINELFYSSQEDYYKHMLERLQRS